VDQLAQSAQAGAGIEAILDRIPCLAGRPRTLRELPGGLTNLNVKVTTPAGAYVARVWSRGDFLAINREDEHANSRAAHAAGVGAPVIDYRPDLGVLVLGFIAGRTFTAADVCDPANLRRIALACRTLHSGPRFVSDMDMFAAQERYLAVVTGHNFGLPRGYHDLRPAFEAARAALAARAGPTVPCNNDLLAGNFIDDGSKLWLIDYEYAGNNDPCFELGNIASESSLSAEALAELVTHYFGVPRRAKIARAALFALVAKYAWTLWGVIQRATSPIEFDFWSWTMERYEAAATGMTAASYRRLLDDVQRDD
jgi:thiamine kinase-like enzyme